MTEPESKDQERRESNASDETLTEEKEETTPRLTPPDVRFAFGPENNWLIQCRNAFRGQTEQSEAKTWDDLRIKEGLIVFAFKHINGMILGGTQDGDNNKPIVAITENQNKMIKTGEVEAYAKANADYKRLFDWLKSAYDGEYSNLRDTFITIGPGGSYWARCRDSFIEHQLPSDLSEILKKALEDGIRKPAHVALGVNDSWICLWDNGERTWSLNNAYSTLADYGTLSRDSGEIVFVALSPYNNDDYLLVHRNGLIDYRTRLPSAEGSKILHAVANDYMQVRAKEQGIELQHNYTQDGVTGSWRIGPDTDFQLKKPSDVRIEHDGGGRDRDSTQGNGRKKRNLFEFSCSCFCHC